MGPDEPRAAERPAVRDPESRARTHLANERTFLAWLRTGVSLLALGLAADQFLPNPTPGLAALLVGGGLLLTLAGAWQYWRGRDQIESGRYQPDSRAVVLSLVLVLAFSLLAIAFVIVGD